MVPSLLRLIRDLEKKDKDEAELGRLTEEFVLVQPYTAIVRVTNAKNMDRAALHRRPARCLPSPKYFTYYPGISIPSNQNKFELIVTLLI